MTKHNLLCTAALASLLSAPLHAQTATSVVQQNSPVSSDPDVNDIIVTAQKRSQSINDVPMSITALSGDTLAQSGITNATDLGAVVPGFSFTKTADSQPIFFLRGIGYFDNNLGASPAVTSYIDEVPLPYPILTGGATLDLERVEVLKGPQGTLFGQNSTGGALNFVPAKPTSKFAAGVNGSFGRFSAANVNGFISGPITDTLKARLSAQYERSGDWQRSYTRRDSSGEANRGAARLLVDWTPDDRFSATLNLNGWFDKSDLQQGQLAGLNIAIPGFQSPILASGNGTPGNPIVQVYPAAPRDPRAADWTPGIKNAANNRYWQTALRANYELAEKMNLTSITAYQHLDYFQRPDADGTTLRIDDFPQDGFIKAFSQELRLSGELGRLNWVLGGNYMWDRVKTLDNVISPDQSLPIDTLELRNDQTSKTLAAFGNAEFKITDQLTLQGGLRYTDFKQKFRGCEADSGDGNAAAAIGFLTGFPIFTAGNCVTIDDIAGTFAPGEVRLTNKSDNLSWRASVNYQPNRDILLYANVSRGYKTSSFPIASFLLKSFYVPPKQESVLAYETGFKATMADRRVQLNAAVFYYDYTDKQLLGLVIDPIIGPTEKPLNVPKTRIMGGEFDLTLRPVEGLTINANATYVDSKVKSNFVSFTSDGSGPLNIKGESFPYTPKWQLGGTADYVLPLTEALNGTIGSTVTYRSATKARFGDTSKIFALPQYALLDLRAGIEAPDRSWYAQIWGRNITNKYYRTSVGKILDTIVAYTGRPATYGVTAGYRF